MKKRQKTLLLMGISGILSLGCYLTAMAGQWSKDDKGYRWQEDDGSYVVSDWRQVDGKWYYFGEDSYMYADGWGTIPTQVNYMGEVVTEDKIYGFDASGAMMTSGDWEGGCILSNGQVCIDDANINQNGDLIYTRMKEYTEKMGVPPRAGISDSEDYIEYIGTIEWKKQMLTQLKNSLGSSSGTYTMDFQLPSNYAEECPNPIMTAGINAMCFYAWGGYDKSPWEFTWQVDENYVIHITVTFYGL